MRRLNAYGRETVDAWVRRWIIPGHERKILDQISVSLSNDSNFPFFKTRIFAGGITHVTFFARVSLTKREETLVIRDECLAKYPIFSRTRAALLSYHEMSEIRAVFVDAARLSGDAEDFINMQAISDRHVRNVQEAFYRDTHDFNTLEQCLRLPVEDIIEATS